MCTVSYIPLANGCVFTSNRDEMPAREASLDPDFYVHDHISLYFPKDPQGKGTWIAVSEDERIACLLNGGFETHVHHPPYRRSRGLVVLESFNYNSPFEFYTNVDLEGVEPFTLILVWANCPYELKWTGFSKHFISLPKAPCLWASATLYDQRVVSTKRQWFDEFLRKTPAPQQAEVIHFHKHGGIPDKINGMSIERPGSVKTLSITSIQMSRGEVNIVQDRFSSVFEDTWDSHFKGEYVW
jgi:hypothetical protein